jgi:hypothetical protein
VPHSSEPLLTLCPPNRHWISANRMCPLDIWPEFAKVPVRLDHPEAHVVGNPDSEYTARSRMGKISAQLR